MTMCTSHCSNEIIEAIIVALAPACPIARWAAGAAGCASPYRHDPRTGRRFIWHMFQARPGGGGSVTGDGLSTIGEWHSAGGIKFGSIEVAETRFPLFFETHEYRPGSAGDGRFVAAMAAICVCGWRPRRRPANTAGEGIVHGARGCWGARMARRTITRLLAPGERPQAEKQGDRRSGATRQRVPCRSGGGGGYGDPAPRDPAAREADRTAGLSILPVK